MLMTIFEMLYDFGKRFSDKEESRRQRLAQSLVDIGNQLSEAARLLADFERYDATEARRAIQEYAQKLPALLSDDLTDEELKCLTESLNAVNIPPSINTASRVLEFELNETDVVFEESWKNAEFRTFYAMQLKEAAGICKALGRLMMAR